MRQHPEDWRPGGGGLKFRANKGTTSHRGAQRLLPHSLHRPLLAADGARGLGRRFTLRQQPKDRFRFSRVVRGRPRRDEELVA